MDYHEIEIPWTDGLIYKVPKPKRKEDVVGWDLPKKDQKWRRFPTPNFSGMSEVDKTTFFERELERKVTGVHFMNNGIVEYITGNHYWFLQHWNLGGSIYPRFFNWQKILAYFIDLCRNDENCFGGQVLASKRGGKSEFLPCEFLSDAMLQEVAGYIIQAQNDTKSKKLFRRTLRAFHAQKRTLPYTYHHFTTQNEIIFKNALASKKTTKKITKDDIAESDHVSIGAYPSKIDFIQGETTRGIFLDEYCSQELMDMTEWFDTAIAQCSEGIGRKIIGKIWLIATPERAKSKSLPFAIKLYDDSDPKKRNANGRTASGLYRMLVPYYESTPDFIDDYGYSNIEAAKAFFDNMCEGKSEGQIRELKRKYISCKEDAFSLLSGKVFEADVRMKLEHANKQSEFFPVQYVDLAEIKGEIVKTNYSKDNDTRIKIVERIQKNTKYSLGIDPSSTDDETGNDEGSKYAAVITKGFGEGDLGLCYTPVMAYAERALNKQECYQKIYLMARYVIDNGGELEIIGEINGGGADCFHYLCNKGLKKYMTGTPKEYANENEGDKKGKYWLYVNGDVLHFLHGLGNRFGRVNFENFKMKCVVESLLKYKGGQNEDLASAFIISLMNFRGFDKIEKKKSVRQIIGTRSVFINGVMRYEAFDMLTGRAV